MSPAEERMPGASDESREVSDALAGVLSGPQLPGHLYIHVPFCRTKCSYCDFYSVDDLSEVRIEMVLRGIEAEMTRWRQASLPGVLETVYLGGGTPTVIVGGAVRLVREALERFPVRAGAEVTVEANPDSVTPELIEALAAAGATRVSLGVQSFVDSELGMLGRVHTVQEARSAADHIRAAGLELSLDLMCAIPGQTPASWTSSLEAAVATGARHLSVYPLTLEEGTPLAVACGTGLVEEPDPDLAATMMLIAEELLSSHGLQRYEVANFAVPGHEARHNLSYWTGRPYLACGPSAHAMLDAPTALAVGFLDDEDIARGAARVRVANPADIDEWMTSPEVMVEILDAGEVAREDVMLGLRLSRGVPVGQVEAAGLAGVLESLESDGLVERVGSPGAQGAAPGRDERWRTTTRGWLLGNEVFGRVWNGE